MKKSILFIVALILVPVACRAVFSGDNGEPAQGVHPNAIAADTSESDRTALADPAIDMNHLLGHIDPTTDASFSRVGKPYTNREDLYLLDEVHHAFMEMHKAARRDGIALTIVSATRNFDAQKKIWEGKWTGARLVDGRNLAKTVPDPIARARIILRYSSMPGTSRHHWGTDIDINSVENAYFRSATGAKVFQWLAANARNFGFCQTYTAKGNDRPHGYEEEPWHWSYCPIANRYLQQYSQKVTYDHITGFQGAHTAAQIDVIKHYVLAINPKCLKH